MNVLPKRLTTATKSVATMMEGLSVNAGLGMSWMTMECHATGKVREILLQVLPWQVDLYN
jgi:hypothetical protein